MDKTIKKDTTFVANTYARVPVVFEKGKGSERVSGDLAGILIARARKLAKQKVQNA